MPNEILITAIPFTIGLSFAALIAFAAAAFQEIRQGGKAPDVIRRVYVYLVMFITLLIAASSTVTLVDTGLRAQVFTAAGASAYLETPPMLFFSSPEPEKFGSVALKCDGGCTLTDAQRADIANWKTSYEDWQQRTSANRQQAQNLIDSISFLLVSIVVFALHWFMARRDRQSGGNPAMRTTYLWAISFVMLVGTVVSAGFLLNTGLRTAFLKGDAGLSGSGAKTPAMIGSSPERTSLDSVVTCGEQCGLDAATIQLAKNWQQDYERVVQRTNAESQRRDRHNALSRELAFLVVFLPLFVWHLRSAQRERHSPTPPPVPTPTT